MTDKSSYRAVTAPTAGAKNGTLKNGAAKTARRDPPPANCELDALLHVLSGAWTTQILWYLQCGERRFGELQRDLGDVSRKVLAQQLRRLEAHGVLARVPLGAKIQQVEYRLTPFGRKLCPVLDKLIALAGEMTTPRLKAD